MNIRKINIIICILNILLIVIIGLSIVPSIIDSNYSTSLQSTYKNKVEDMLENSAVFIIMFGIVNIVNGIINRKKLKYYFGILL